MPGLNSDSKYDARSWFDSVVGTRWDTENETYTIWGDHTKPFDSKIGKYYTEYVFPVVPHQLFEAAQFLITQNESYIPENTDIYSWIKNEGEWINWISEIQCQDFKSTLQNMKGDYIPSYLKEENNAPLSLDQQEMDSQIVDIIKFYDTHGHMFISTGSFMADNISNKSANFVRFTQEDGYPFAEDYFRKILSEKKLRIEAMDVPSVVETGEKLEVTVDCKVYESYPDDLVRNLTEDDNPSTELILMKDGEEISKINPSLIDSTFKGKFSTNDLTPGRYTVKFVGNLPDMIKNVTKSQNVVIEDSHVEVGVYALYITPSRIPVGGDVEIVAWGITSDDYSITVSFIVDNETIKMIDIPNGTEFEIQEEYTFDDPGTHEISVGGQVGTVTVVQPIPKVSDFDMPDKEIVEEEVTISAVVENTEQFEYNYSLLIDGNIVRNIDLGPGESKTVTIHHVFESTGSHTVSIGDEKKIIDIVEPIVVEDVDIDDDEINEGEKVKITAEITNNDDIERNVDINIDGDMVGSLNVKPGTDTYTYKHKFDEKGAYEITVGEELAGEVEVKEKETPGFIFTILLLALSIVLIYNYKKKRNI